MSFRVIASTAACAVLLAGCSSPDEEGPAEDAAAAAPVPAPVMTSTPTPTVAADGSPLAAGAWSVNEDANGASARFVSQEGADLLGVTCDRNTRLISLVIASAAPGNQTFVIQSAGNAARLDTISDNGNPPHQGAAIAADAPVFGGFVQPGSTIEVSQPGGSTLRVPAAAGIRRVFEACR